MCLAIPGKLLSIDGEDPITRTGKVDFGGIVKEVSLACLPEVEIGQYVLVHVGLAISIVDEAQASLVFEYLNSAGELDELEPQNAIH